MGQGAIDTRSALGMILNGRFDTTERRGLKVINNKALEEERQKDRQREGKKGGRSGGLGKSL